MKKPEIDIHAKKIMVSRDVYSEMIDALIDAKDKLELIYLTNEVPPDTLNTVNNIFDALKKAGCE